MPPSPDEDKDFSAELVAQGDALRRARARARLTVSGAAQALGISRVVLGRWERGEHDVRVVVARRLAQVYRVTLGQLVGDEPLPGADVGD